MTRPQLRLANGPRLDGVRVLLLWALPARTQRTAVRLRRDAGWEVQATVAWTRSLADVAGATKAGGLGALLDPAPASAQPTPFQIHPLTLFTPRNP